MENETRVHIMSDPVRKIVSTGPDFFPNSFTAYFLWEGEETLPLTQDGRNHFSQFDISVLSREGFAVRIGDITLPKTSNEKFTVDFLESKVSKMRSSKATSHKSSFTFRLDSNLVWLDFIDAAAGHINTIDEHVAAGSKSHPMTHSLVNKDGSSPEGALEWRRVIKTLARTWTPKYNINSRRTGLSLIGKINHLSNYLDPLQTTKYLPYFVFENIRILGTTDSIEYTHEPASPKMITVEFIFRRLYQLNGTNYDKFAKRFDPVSRAEGSRTGVYYNGPAIVGGNLGFLG